MEKCVCIVYMRKCPQVVFCRKMASVRYQGLTGNKGPCTIYLCSLRNSIFVHSEIQQLYGTSFCTLFHDFVATTIFTEMYGMIYFS